MKNRRKPEANDAKTLLEAEENHFFDLKSKRIDPAKLQESFVSFANADGGDLWVGIEDKKVHGERIIGFANEEEANQLIEVLLEQTHPSVEGVDWEFVDFGSKGLVLHFEIPKSPKVHFVSDGKTCFVRINAQKKRIIGDRIIALGYAKGSASYEKRQVEDGDIAELRRSKVLKSYITRIGSNLTPGRFLKKNRLEIEGKPSVASIVLFDDEPQAALATRCGIKIYRLKTTSATYDRKQLAEDPISISGDLESAVNRALDAISKQLEGVTFIVGGKSKKLKYPTDAIKEIVVNAAIHRDYSLNDDIHIRIYDDRIEVQSPGKLPGYVTQENIYEERFSRNPIIVRLINKLPNPLNKDIGEGLDTAKSALRRLGLVEPEFLEHKNSLVVTIRHKKIASIEDSIVEYFTKHPKAQITNKVVRELTGEQDVQKVKSALQKMLKAGKLQRITGDRMFDYKYTKGNMEK